MERREVRKAGSCAYADLHEIALRGNKKCRLF